MEASLRQLERERALLQHQSAENLRKVEIETDRKRSLENERKQKEEEEKTEKEDVLEESYVCSEMGFQYLTAAVFLT